MTDTLRAAAQALVDRWDTPNWKDAPPTREYINALRAALAAPPRYRSYSCPICAGSMLEDEPQPEPVAWQLISPDGKDRFMTEFPDTRDGFVEGRWKSVPLYTAPALR